MKEIIKSIFVILLAVIPIVILLVIRFNNPQLTETQLFLNYFWYYVICVIVEIYSCYLSQKL